MSTETIYVLPGMGADSTMYSGVWRTLPNCLFIEWPGLDDAVLKPAQIHGKFDRVIPVPPDAQKVVDGGHLIAMTHAQE